MKKALCVVGQLSLRGRFWDPTNFNVVPAGSVLKVSNVCLEPLNVFSMSIMDVNKQVKGGGVFT